MSEADDSWRSPDFSKPSRPITFDLLEAYYQKIGTYRPAPDYKVLSLSHIGTCPVCTELFYATAEPIAINWRGWHAVVHAEPGGDQVFVERGWEFCPVCRSLAADERRQVGGIVTEDVALSDEKKAAPTTVEQVRALVRKFCAARLPLGSPYTQEQLMAWAKRQNDAWDALVAFADGTPTQVPAEVTTAATQQRITTMQKRIDDLELALSSVATCYQDERPLNGIAPFDWRGRSMKQEDIARRALAGTFPSETSVKTLDAGIIPKSKSFWLIKEKDGSQGWTIHEHIADYMRNGRATVTEVVPASDLREATEYFTEQEVESRVSLAVAAAVKLDRESICAHLQGPGLKPSEGVQTGDWTLGVLDSIDYIRSRPSPAVDVLALIRKYFRAKDAAKTITLSMPVPIIESAVNAEADAEASLRGLVDGTPAKPAVDVLGMVREYFNAKSDRDPTNRDSMLRADEAEFALRSFVGSAPAKPAVDVLAVVREWRDARGESVLAYASVAKYGLPETRQQFEAAQARLASAEAALVALVPGAAANGEGG